MTVTPEDRAGSVRRPAAPPRLADGVELIGPYRGSGYREPKYLIGRADGQVIQVPALLYALAERLDGQRDTEQLAVLLSRDTNQELTAENVEYLIEEKLRPVGITAGPPESSGEPEKSVPAPRPDPLLLLRHRVPVLPPRVVGVIAAIFQPLHRLPVVLAAIAAFIGVDIWLVLAGALGEFVPAATALIYEPALTLLVFALIVASGIFHEFGHVSACRYGGARPGSVGVGIYIVWPAMYSTVTDAYRLDRIGRLRTDLGGIYFNVIFLAGLGLAYLETGAPWLLVAVVLLHVETAWQFLPSIRLDGYYILADLVGVPDLFSLIGPVLASALPGRTPHRRVTELKPWARRVITLWVLIVVPLLAYWLTWFLVLIPRLLPVVWDAMGSLVVRMTAAVASGSPAEFTLASINFALLLLPPVGMTMVWYGIVRRVIVAIRTRRARRGGAPTTPRPTRFTAAIARLRPARWLIAGTLAAGFVTGLVLAAFGRRPVSVTESHIVATVADPSSVGWPDAFVAHHVAILARIWPGGASMDPVTSARVGFLVLSVVAAALLWVVARRLGLRPPAAAAAAVLCAVPAPLHDLVDAGGLAVVYLAVAAVLVGRGRWANGVAGVAAAASVVTAPLVAVGGLALAACAMAQGGAVPQVFRRMVPGVLTGVAVAVAAFSIVDWYGTRDATRMPVFLTAGLVVVGGAVLVRSWPNRSLRPVTAAGGALLGCALLPGSHAVTALLLATPVVAVLAAALLDRTHQPSAQQAQHEEQTDTSHGSPAPVSPQRMSPH